MTDCNATRTDIYHILAERPGKSIQELTNLSDVSYGTVQYHVQILIDNDFVSAVTYRGSTRYTPKRTPLKKFHAARNMDPEGCILMQLYQKGPLSGSELADLIKRDQSTVSYHLCELEDEGLINRRRKGGYIENELSADVRKVQDKLRSRRGPTE